MRFDDAAQHPLLELEWLAYCTAIESHTSHVGNGKPKPDRGFYRVFPRVEQAKPQPSAARCWKQRTEENISRLDGEERLPWLQDRLIPTDNRPQPCADLCNRLWIQPVAQGKPGAKQSEALRLGRGNGWSRQLGTCPQAR